MGGDDTDWMRDTSTGNRGVEHILQQPQLSPEQDGLAPVREVLGETAGELGVELHFFLAGEAPQLFGDELPFILELDELERAMDPLGQFRGGPDSFGESLAVAFEGGAGILDRLQGVIEFGELGVVGAGDMNAGLGQLGPEFEQGFIQRGGPTRQRLIDRQEIEAHTQPGEEHAVLGASSFLGGQHG